MEPFYFIDLTTSSRADSEHVSCNMYYDLCNGSRTTDHIGGALQTHACHETDIALIEEQFTGLANGSLALLNGTLLMAGGEYDNNGTAKEDGWSVEGYVNLMVPFCFGIIGVLGLAGNALVITGIFIYIAGLLCRCYILQSF